MEVQMRPIFRFTQWPKCFCSIKAFQECLNITKTHRRCNVFVKAIWKKSLSCSPRLPRRRISLSCTLLWIEIIKSLCRLYKWNKSYWSYEFPRRGSALTHRRFVFSLPAVWVCYIVKVIIYSYYTHPNTVKGRFWTSRRCENMKKHSVAPLSAI